MKTFSVIIAHLNNHTELYYTIWDLLKELDGFDYEIIIIDNGSEKGNFESVKQYVDKIAIFHNIKLFRYLDYQGTVPPWQKGAQKASGKYLIFIDSHVTTCRDYFKKQYEVLNNDKDIKVLYSASSFTNYGIDTSHNYSFDKTNLSLSFLKLNEVSQEHLSEPLVSQMGCVIVEREFFLKIGMFGKCFLKYGGYGAEELILAFKTKMFGGKVVFNRDVFFHHSILHKGHGGKKLKLQNKAIAAYILDGYDYMLSVLKEQKEFNEIFDGSSEAYALLIEEIPKVSKKDRELLLTAPISYREILKKYE